MNQRGLPVIGVTMGDPAGVGPELCLRLLQESSLKEELIPIVFGDAAVLCAASKKTGIPFETSVQSLESWLGRRSDGDSRVDEVIRESQVIDVKAIGLNDFQPGSINAATGRAGFTYVDRAIDAALAGKLDAITTAPLSKEAMFMAGIRYPGHTEIFAERTGSDRWCMMQYSAAITCTFVTVHVGYAEVPAFLSTERVLAVIELTHEALRKLRGRPPRLVVCGLNPHAGEHGLFGNREEERIIIPAIEAARARGFDIEGPLPADTAFIPQKRERTDAYICMYHDQGHIPVKALAFDLAVNTTLGIPLIRTSVDHGTALDIAWQGVANPSSLYAAARLAVRMVDTPLAKKRESANT